MPNNDSSSGASGKRIVAGPGNRLANSRSLYLLQHAHNPVNWYPWGEEAFELARRDDKPLFISIGYSSCHWCHVMAHESFEDPDVAALINQVFVPIKVDREERPDVDQVYMEACQRMTGRGGWPLTIVATTDGKPFFADTYLPKESRFGMDGLIEIISRIEYLWKNRRDEVLKSADKITSALQPQPVKAGKSLGVPTLDNAYVQLSTLFDPMNGGFGGAPKFPTPHNLLFLMRQWRRTGNPEALEMVEATLQSMRMGGIFDQVGFGFHRYSTDAQWHIPHFEKMLYDQALLTMAYVEAYQATSKPEYAYVAREILDYTSRVMTSPDGGFYSSEDADSEGVEGKFYIWRAEELRDVLEREEYSLVIRVFDVKEGGNLPGSRENILRMQSSMKDAASVLKLPEDELRNRLEAVRKKLFAAREMRVHPGRDEKILADWNGLIIATLAKAAVAMNDTGYAATARRAADFILSNMRSDEGRLSHVYGAGSGSVSNLDDYAFMVWGLIELYQATFELAYLQSALELTKEGIEHFWDGHNGGFYFTPDYGEKLLMRKKEIYDGAVPSGNSVFMYNLLRLSHLTGDPEMEKRAHEVSKAFSSEVRGRPAAYAMLMLAVDFAVGPSYEVAIVGGLGMPDTSDMRRALGSGFFPRMVVLLLTPEKRSDVGALATFAKGFSSEGGKATAYVCSNHTCSLPTTDIEKMLGLICKGDPR